MTLSVIIITKNEADNIERCLQSVAWADEIIIVDSGSADNTLALAKKYTKNITSAEWEGFGVQKQRALSKATGDWVLNIDADESVSPKLKKEIQKVINSQENEAYRIPIYLHFYGKTMRHSLSPTRRIRLFKRAGARYSDDLVHEQILLPSTAKVGQLSESILHHSYRDVTHALSKLNQYTSYTAKSRAKKYNKPSLLSVLMSARWMFFRCFILQLGFLDGKAGFILAVLSMQSAYYRGIKQIYPDQMG